MNSSRAGKIMSLLIEKSDTDKDNSNLNLSTADDNKSLRSSDSAFMINKYFNSFPDSSDTGISEYDKRDMEIQNSLKVKAPPALKDICDLMNRDQKVISNPSSSVNLKSIDGESVVYETSGSEYFPSDIETEADEDYRVEKNIPNQKEKRKLRNTEDSHRTIAEKTNSHKVVDTKESKKPAAEACDQESKTEETGEIYIRSSLKTSEGKRKRNKVYCCLYCNKMLKELSKHLDKKHSDESEVQKLLAKPKKDASRRQGFIHLAKVGNYYHNCEVLKQRSGELILARVPTAEEKKMHTYSDYGPCPDCLAFMLKRHLWHHLAQSCTVKSNSGLRRRPLLECNTLLAHTCSELHPSPDFNQYILSAFKTDDISLICKQDILIIKFGEMQFEKYHTTQAELIRQCMRQLARLVKELRKVDQPKLWLSEWLNPAGFDIIVSAVKNLCKVECMRQSRPKYITPSLALKIGYHLRKCIAISKAQCLRREDTNAINTLNNFQSLMDMEWTSKISSNALRTLFDRKINAVELLPITEDLLKLNKYLNSHLQMCKEALEQSQSYITWRNLARIVLCKIVLFNKRRSGEISRMTVTNYSSRPNWSQQTTSEFQKTFTDLEKQLFNRLAIVQIKGKRGSTVNVLLTDEVKDSIDSLILYRSSFISSENTYLFARETPSLEYIRGHDCLRNFCKEIKLSQPELITSTKLRKYIATVSQVFNLSENETDWLARHLGHDIRVHRQFYRLHESSIELTKVSRILLAVEKGEVNRFKGKSLNEINICDLPEMENEVEGSDCEYGEKEDEKELNDIAEDVADTSVAKSKNFNKSQVVKKKKTSIRRCWSDEESAAVLQFFRASIKKGITPGKSLCTECIEKYPILSLRSWSDVKFFVYNHIKKVNKKK